MTKSTKKIKPNTMLLSAGVAIVVLVITILLVKGPIASLSDKSQVFSKSRIATEIWEGYKQEYLEASSGRTLDKQRDSITTSEGESYTMLRAVWMDDPQTFDKSWQWTKDNLQRSDHLMSWKFGKRADGTYGIQTELGGATSASDADTDIAVALLMAHQRWNNSTYLYDALPIIESIWEKDVVNVQDKPVLAANDIEKTKLPTDPVIVNPSYFAPYAYRLFATVDLRHNWQGLVDNTYAMLEKISRTSFGNYQASGLPPNWVEIDQQTGAITASRHTDLDTNYGYDAFRTPLRLALDWQWSKDERAKKALQRFSFLADQWQQHRKLYAVYGNNGQPRTSIEAPAAYGASLGYFTVMRPELARDIYTTKLESLYSLDHMGWKHKLSYYDDNWAWFGIALYNNDLIDLTEHPTN